MAYILQHRRDTLANWNKVNPILADAEIGFILDKDENGKQKSSLYKIGDGKTPWNDLPLFGFGGNVYNNFKGNDLSTSVASRQAILDKFNELNEELDASLVQSISPEEEESEDIMKQQVVSRWALLEEFQNIWGDVRGNKEQINSLVVDVQGVDDPINGHQPGLNDKVTLTMEEVKVLKQFAETYGPVVTTHSSDIEGLKTLTANIPSIESDIKTLKANPKFQILSEENFSNLNENYEENTLYFIYKEEINQ